MMSQGFPQLISSSITVLGAFVMMLYQALLTLLVVDACDACTCHRHRQEDICLF